MTRTSTSATTECDVFFVQKILQVVFLINFCACPFPRVKYKGDVLGHQLFEAYLPSLLHRLYKQRRWRVSERVQEAKKVLDEQPKLSSVWTESADPEFLLLSDVPDDPKIQQSSVIKKREKEVSGVMEKRGLSLTSNLDLLRQHSGYSRGDDRGRALASRGKKWSGVANNMQLLREGSWERRPRGDRLYMEVARRQEGGLANLG